MPRPNAYNGDKINPEYVDMILEQMSSGGHPYLDVCVVQDMLDFLRTENRHKDAQILVAYGLELHPNSNELMLEQGSLMIDNDNMAGAAERLNYLEPTMSHIAQYHIVKGWYYLKSEQQGKAIEEFDQASELCKDDIDLNFEIGMNLNQFGLHKYAVKYLRIFNKAFPNDAEGLFELAFALESTGKIDESRRKYEELVDISPFYETAWYNLGILYSNAKEYDNAIMAYETATAINPEYPEPYYNMANTFLCKNEIEAGLNNYIEYATLCEPDQLGSVMQNIGECWWEMGENIMARRFYQKAIERDGENFTSEYGLALCDIELELYDEAISVLDHAMKTEEGSNNADPHFAKAHALAMLERRLDAYYEIMAGIVIEPNIVFAWMEAYKIYVHDISRKGQEEKFFDEYRSKFGENGAFKLINAYHIFLINSRNRQIKEIVEWVAENDKKTIADALEEPDLKKMLTKEPFAGILTKAGIEL